MPLLMCGAGKSFEPGAHRLGLYNLNYVSIR